MQNLSKLLKRLLESDVDFVLAGGFASVVHGSTLVTQDLDICVLLNADQIEKLRTALRDLNPRHRMNPSFTPSFLTEPQDLSTVENLYLRTDLGVLDILSKLPPAGSFADIRARAVAIELYGHQCQVISLEDLILIKESMSRPKDVQTLSELKALRNLKR